jgi:hypothetical protein
MKVSDVVFLRNALQWFSLVGHGTRKAQSRGFRQRKIRYKIGPLGKRTKVGFKFCVRSRCDPATALIAGNHHGKCPPQRFRATGIRFSV